jgi:hypothetical protein
MVLECAKQALLEMMLLELYFHLLLADLATLV